MKRYASELIKIAQAEIGYLEKASNKDLDDKTANAGKKNFTKYARDLDRISGFFNGRKNGFDWCAVFVCWCFVQAFGVVAAKKLLGLPGNSSAAGVLYFKLYMDSIGRFYRTNPKPGDVIFFVNKSGNFQHTGIVYAVDKSRVYTIEGNTSGASGVVPNGGGVRKKSYALSYARIAGYGRPAFDPEPELSAPTPATGSASIKIGDIVNFTGSKHYVGANASIGPSCRPGKARVTAIAPGKKHPYHLVKISGGGSTVYGWVDADDIEGLAAEWIPAVGDIVNFAGSTHYSGANSATGKPCEPGKAKITRIYRLGKSKHPYHLVKISGGGSTVYGWVDAGTFAKG